MKYKVSITRWIEVDATDEFEAEIKAGEQDIDDWYDDDPIITKVR
jgi:hypothetical protein